MNTQIRNIAIIAHVDHGKTTLVDQLLRQSGTFRENEKLTERVMDSNDLERERGITILAKNCAVKWKGTHINIVDTPGHADFGGEVERVLSMVDGVLLLVDAVEGPMPQTRFVTKKALALGLKPIVVVNKVDRPGARPDYVINATFDLFDKLHATEDQLDFPVIFASGLNGWATRTQGEIGTDLAPLFDAVVEHVPPHEGSETEPLQLQICSLDYSSYVGRIGIGRVHSGILKPMMDVAVYEGPDSTPRKARVNQVLKFEGLVRMPAESAGPGDIVLVNGIEDIGVGVTLTDIDNPRPLPMLKIDEPTLTMNFCVNTSPLAGREGKFVTSRQIWERLQRELQSNVALKVKDTDEDGIFEVSGRGELHLTILLENMRREGYELAVSKPRVVFHDVEWREARADRTRHRRRRRQPPGRRDAGLGRAPGRTRQHGNRRHGPRAPGVPHPGARPHRLLQRVHEPDARHRPHQQHLRRLRAYKGEIAGRKNGVLISQDDGEIVTYALGKLDDRGRMFVKAGDPVYEGMIIGIHSRDNDLVVNAVRGKQLTNFRVVRQGRRDQDHAGDRPLAGVRGGVHRGRRAGRDHAEEHSPAQALPERARPQAGFSREAA